MSRLPSGSERPVHDAVALAVTESSQVGEARRVAAALAARLGFSAEDAGKVALVITEVAANLVKHARGGILLLRRLEQGEALGIEVLAVDSGPGMADVGRCLRDGFSTAGTPGTGLGAITRVAAFADIYSTLHKGTVLVARLWAQPSPPAHLRVGAVSVPVAGEQICGDAWAVVEQGDRALALVADGLGHGPLAAEAARAAVRTFHDNTALGPAEILRLIHLALRSTRGAAAAVAALDLAAGTLCYAGVGNISGAVLAPAGDHHMVSHNGTLGHQAFKFQEFAYAFPEGATLVMHSDGLLSRWGLEPYSGLGRRDPALIAGVLYRDFQRGRDDVTVLAVARADGSEGGA